MASEAGIWVKNFLVGINVLKCGERKKLLKHLVGIRKGSTFAIPNDEGVKMRGWRKEESWVEGRSCWEEMIFENNGTKVADGLEMFGDIEEPTGVR